MLKSYLENKTFQALLFCNAAILALTIFFIAILEHTAINVLIVISGWTSLGALVLGDYLGIKLIKTEMLIGEADIKDAILHLDRWIKALDQFADTPEGQEFIRKLIKTMSLMEKLVGG